MFIDRQFFFTRIRRLFNNRLDQAQVDGMGTILAQWEARLPNGDPRWLAYMFATTFHETARRMTPVREAYWLSEDWRRRNLAYYPYYGRGYVQLTHLENYKKAGQYVGANLAQFPDLALRLDYAAVIMFVGMEQGWFRRDSQGPHSLPRYFNRTVNNPLGARAIINGYEAGVAEAIAGYHAEFLASIRPARDVTLSFAAQLSGEHPPSQFGSESEAEAPDFAATPFSMDSAVPLYEEPGLSAIGADGAASMTMQSVTSIITSYVSRNAVEPEKLPELIVDVYNALKLADRAAPRDKEPDLAPVETPQERKPPRPAVAKAARRKQEE